MANKMNSDPVLQTLFLVISRNHLSNTEEVSEHPVQRHGFKVIQAFESYWLTLSFHVSDSLRDYYTT